MKSMFGYMCDQAYWLSQVILTYPMVTQRLGLHTQ